jgi:hypothetical protein
VPELLALAGDGDRVAQGLVRRQGCEIATCAAAVLQRLGLADRAVPVVIGGGIGASGDPLLTAAIAAGLAERVPQARWQLLDRAPVLGAVAEARRRLDG